MIAEQENINTMITYAHQIEDDYTIGVAGAIPSRLGVIGVSYFKYTLGGLIRYDMYTQEVGTFSLKTTYFILLQSE